VEEALVGERRRRLFALRRAPDVGFGKNEQRDRHQRGDRRRPLIQLRPLRPGADRHGPNGDRPDPAEQQDKGELPPDSEHEVGKREARELEKRVRSAQRYGER
jgi:hypothetical protein